MTRSTSILLTAILVLGSALPGCGDADQTAGGDQGAAGAAGGTTVGAAPGNQAPDFDLDRIDGGRLTLSELKGRAVLVDFWDTWCPPCREALPHLQALSVEYDGKLEVVGVAIGRFGRDEVAKFVNKNGLTFPIVLIDPQYETAKAFGGVPSIPTTFLIDADGIVREVWQGYHDKQTYENALLKVLGT